MTTMFPSDGIWVTGDVIQGGLRSDERKHSYCRSCLGFVYSRIKGADHRVNLRTSLLGDAAGFEPFVEVMTDQKLPWVQLPVVHSFAQAPKSREELQALMDAYAGRSDV